MSKEGEESDFSNTVEAFSTLFDSSTDNNATLAAQVASFRTQQTENNSIKPKYSVEFFKKFLEGNKNFLRNLNNKIFEGKTIIENLALYPEYLDAIDDELRTKNQKKINYQSIDNEVISGIVNTGNLRALIFLYAKQAINIKEKGSYLLNESFKDHNPTRNRDLTNVADFLVDIGCNIENGQEVQQKYANDEHKLKLIERVLKRQGSRDEAKEEIFKAIDEKKDDILSGLGTKALEKNKNLDEFKKNILEIIKLKINLKEDHQKEILDILLNNKSLDKSLKKIYLITNKDKIEGGGQNFTTLKNNLYRNIIKLFYTKEQLVKNRAKKLVTNLENNIVSKISQNTNIRANRRNAISF